MQRNPTIRQASRLKCQFTSSSLPVVRENKAEILKAVCITPQNTESTIRDPRRHICAMGKYASHDFLSLEITTAFGGNQELIHQTKELLYEIKRKQSSSLQNEASADFKKRSGYKGTSESPINTTTTSKTQIDYKQMHIIVASYISTTLKEQFH